MKIQHFKTVFLSALAIILFASCAADPNIESAKLGLHNADFESVISAAEKALEENPNNPDAYYYIAMGNLGLSENVALADQRPFLETARKNFLRATELYREQEIDSDESKLSVEMIRVKWQDYYTAAVEPLSFDEENPPEVLEASIQNLKNAATIAPDSVLTYDALSTIYFMKGDMEASVNALIKANEIDKEPDLERYQRLVVFYNDLGEYDSAFDILHEGRDLFPTEIFFVQEIANYHLRLGDTDRAVEVLEELIEIDPNNAEYRLVIGTQIYQAYLAENRRVNELYDKYFDLRRAFSDEARSANPRMSELDRIEKELEAVANQIKEINAFQFEIADQAEEHLLISQEVNPDSPDTNYMLGAINENRGLTLLDQRNLIDDAGEANELEEIAMAHIRKALPFYERTAELEENTDNWIKLFQIYTRLDMMEEAADAMQKAGLDD
jgi:tetratricopeptide (TPR) repeat protein